MILRNYLVGLLLLLGGCGGEAAIPTTPDLTALQRNYDQPTAQLDVDTANEAVGQLPPLEELAAAFRAAGYATDGLKPASDSAEEDPDARIRIQGSVHVTLRCPGDLDAPRFGENGDISLTIGIAESRIKRGIGGAARNCRLRGDLFGLPIPVTANGAFAFDLGGDLGVGSPFSGRLLMEMTGTLEVVGIVFENLSARWTKDSFEYLFQRPSDGSTVVVELRDGSLHLRDRELMWGCQEGQSCGLL